MAKVKIPSIVPSLKISRRLMDAKKQKAVGVIAAFLEDGKVKIGWSKCRKGDKYSKAIAYTIAHGRAIALFEDKAVEVPGSMYEDFVLFVARCVTYFRDKELPGFVDKEEIASAFEVIDAARKAAEAKEVVV